MGPGMYSVAGGEVSIFGGFTISRTVLKTCLQQTASESKIGSKWTCLSSSESTLEGLGTVEGIGREGGSATTKSGGEIFQF